MNLLRQKIRGDRGELALTGWDAVGEREPDISSLCVGEITRTRRSTRRRIASKSKELIAGPSVRHLAKSILEDLGSREEILTGSTISEGDLIDQRIAPATIEASTAVIRRIGTTIGGKLKGQHNILHAVVGGKGEDGRPLGEIGEGLGVPCVLSRAEALLLGGLGIGVIEVNALSRPDKLLDGFGE